MLRKLKQYVSRATNHMVMLVIASVLCCGFCNVTWALDFNNISQLIFFGDSLTDGGFNDLWPTEGIPGEPLPTNKAPTFTTFGGFIWSQYVARDIKGFQLPSGSTPDPVSNNNGALVPNFVSGNLRGINYAAAGSTTNSIGFGEIWAPSLNRQVGFYLSSIPIGQKLDPNAIFFIWSGANDFLTLLFSSPLPTQLQLLKAANTAANNIASVIYSLTARGAKRIVVFSLPNLGLTPFASRAGIPGLPASLKSVSFTFNSMLNTKLGEIIRQTRVKILYIDFYDLLDRLVSVTKAGQTFFVAGQGFKFVNATDPACTDPSAIYCEPGAPNNFVFADQFHPTGMTHRVISLEVEELLKNWQ